MLNWEWYGDTNVVRVFLHCLLKANYCQKNKCGMQLKRGQFITSLSELTKELHLTQQQTRTAISKLISTHEITIKATNKYTIVTVCNYESYQSSEESKQQTKQQAEQQTNNKQTTSKITNKQRTRKEEPRKEIEYNTDNIERQNIEESNTIVLPKKFSLKEKLISDGCSEELTEAYMKIRKAKRAPDSEIAYNGIIREVNKAGISIDVAITECVERNWVGFKADWYFRDHKKNIKPNLFTQQPMPMYDPETEKELARARALRKEQEEREIEETRQRELKRIDNIINYAR